MVRGILKGFLILGCVVQSVYVTESYAQTRVLSQSGYEWSNQLLDHSSNMDHDAQPLGFTKTALDRSLQLASALLGEVIAATKYEKVAYGLKKNVRIFSYQVMNLHILYVMAQKDIERKIRNNPDQQDYLLEEVDHLKERVAMLLRMFMYVMADCPSHEVSTVIVILTRIENETEQMLDTCPV